MGQVFISHIKESKPEIHKFCEFLSSNGIPYWIDDVQLKPGRRWKTQIRRAIESVDFFFACFTKEYETKEVSHMNEEIYCAIDRMRSMPHDSVWFIPIVFRGGSVPRFGIGAGRDLRDIQWIDLSDESGYIELIELMELAIVGEL